MSRYFTNVSNNIKERVNEAHIDNLFTKDAEGEFRKIVAGESGGGDIELPNYLKDDNINFNTDGEIDATIITRNEIVTFMAAFAESGKIAQFSPSELWYIDTNQGGQHVNTTYPLIINAANKLDGVEYIKPDKIEFTNSPGQRVTVSSIMNNVCLFDDSIHVGTGSAPASINRSLIKANGLLINGASTNNNTEYRNKEIIIDNPTNTINLVDLQDSQEKYLKSDKIEFTNGSGLSSDGLSYKEGSTTITKTIKEVFDAVDNSGAVLPEYIGPDHIEFDNNTGLFDDSLKVRNNITTGGGGYNWHTAEYGANEIKYDNQDGLNTRYISLDMLAKASAWYNYVSDPTSTQDTAFLIDGETLPAGKTMPIFDGDKVDGARIMVELTGYTFQTLLANGNLIVRFRIKYINEGPAKFPIFKATLMNIVEPDGGGFGVVDELYIGPTYAYPDLNVDDNSRDCEFIIMHPVKDGTVSMNVSKIYVLLEFGKTMSIPSNLILNA